MQEKPRSAFFVYLLCTLVVTVAFGCRTLLPGQGSAPDQPEPTFEPVEILPTELPTADLVDPSATSLPELPGVTVVTSEKQFYQITGNTEKELRQQMSALGPPDEETGKIFDARTDWTIKWYFYYDKSNNECKIDRAEVSLSLTYIYPEWNPPADAASALVSKWNTYMENLVIHEEAHGSLADDGARIIYQTILDMPPVTTCDALGEATNAAAQEKIDDLKQRQKAYDDETGHGKTQGAVFP